ncbi:MAG: hypothetical protein ACR2KH_07180, partial [Sphingomicrobium sp.]
DVVDVTQILGVAAGTNVLAGGYLRVTTGGLVQVDMDGGADNWVTLSTINGTGAVAVRYLSGGAVTNVSVSRTADSAVKSTSSANSNTVLLGAVAAAGLMSAPAAAQSPMAADDGPGLMGSASIAGGGMANPAASDWSIRSDLAGEIRESLDGGAASLSLSVRGDGATQVSALVAGEAAQAVAMTALPGGTDVPAQVDLRAQATLVAEAVVMPAADFAAAPDAMTVVGHSKANGEVARVVAEALSGGGDNPLDALLDALPGNAHFAVAAAVGGWDFGPMAQFVPQQAAFTAEAFAQHADAPPLA